MEPRAEALPADRIHAPPGGSVPPLPSGFEIGGFEIVKLLGSGGFACVYLAVDLQQDRLVTLKEYLPVDLACRSTQQHVMPFRQAAHADYEHGLRGFLNEAHLLTQFDHPALVRVHRAWQANGTAYMAMPYYEGQTLQTLRRAMPRPPEQAWLLHLLHALLDGLEVLHEAGLLHRDIAPDNILLQPNGQPVLLDFGASRQVVRDPAEAPTAIVKPAFAPIEQYAPAAYLPQGAWTDLYALAAVGRYCITGRAPTPATVRAVEDHMEPLGQVVDELARLHPGLLYSGALLHALDRALAVRPQERPASVSAFRDMLRGQPVPSVMPRQPTLQAGTGVAFLPPHTSAPSLVTDGGMDLHAARAREHPSAGPDPVQPELVWPPPELPADAFQPPRAANVAGPPDGTTAPRLPGKGAREQTVRRLLAGLAAVALIASTLGIHRYIETQRTQDRIHRAMIHALETAPTDARNGGPPDTDPATLGDDPSQATTTRDAITRPAAVRAARTGISGRVAVEAEPEGGLKTAPAAAGPAASPPALPLTLGQPGSSGGRERR